MAGMTPKQIAEIDQNTPAVVSILSALWAGLFCELHSRGLSRKEAMQIVCAYIKATQSGGLSDRDTDSNPSE